MRLKTGLPSGRQNWRQIDQSLRYARGGLRDIARGVRLPAPSSRGSERHPDDTETGVNAPQKPYLLADQTALEDVGNLLLGTAAVTASNLLRMLQQRNRRPPELLRDNLLRYGNQIGTLNIGSLQEGKGLPRPCHERSGATGRSCTISQPCAATSRRSEVSRPR